MNALLGTKVRQSQMFDERGFRVPVTIATVGPCVVTQVITHPTKTNVQLAFGVKKNTTRALSGHIQKAGLTIQPRFLREIATQDALPTVGATIRVEEVFSSGDKIRVTGTSKGKGFAGVVKRHGFAGMPRTHGTSDRERAPGSLGATTTPGRVFRGKRMAGRMGTETVTVRGLQVMHVDAEKNTITIRGLVPGGFGGLLIIQKEA